MQRTFVNKNASTLERRPDNLFKRRAISTDVKSPSEILQLIKMRRSGVNETYIHASTEEEDPEVKPIRLILPKISSSNHHPYIPYSRNITTHSQYSDRSHRLSLPPEKQYITIEKQSVHECNSKQQIEVVQSTQTIFDLINSFPKTNKNKSLNKMLPLIEFLNEFNPFFKNISLTMISSFLKVCKIMHFTRMRWIYKKNDPLDSFFIILWGKVKIVNCQKGFKKSSVKGETLCEQVIFTEFNQKNTRQQGAKAATQCFLLQVQYTTYLRLYRQLVLKGHKAQFLTMQKLIRRNYILKQSIKNSKIEK